MTLYALIVWVNIEMYQVIRVDLPYEDCRLLEDYSEMQTGEDMECVRTRLEI